MGYKLPCPVIFISQKGSNHLFHMRIYCCSSSSSHHSFSVVSNCHPSLWSISFVLYKFPGEFCHLMCNGPLTGMRKATGLSLEWWVGLGTEKRHVKMYNFTHVQTSFFTFFFLKEKYWRHLLWEFSMSWKRLEKLVLELSSPFVGNVRLEFLLNKKTQV